MIVFDGQMLWAVERQPAGVIGDGQMTVAELIDSENRDPRRGFHASATLRPLKLDDEAKVLLAEQQCALDMVLPEGMFVRLHRTSNMSSGRIPLAVTDRVHPNNRQLVERAIRLLHLDLAGVDLIIPDIGISWRDSGAAIIEINAQPQLVAVSQNHLYKTIMKARVHNRGRIPVVIVLGTDAQAFAENVLLHMVDKKKGSVGFAS